MQAFWNKTCSFFCQAKHWLTPCTAQEHAPVPGSFRRRKGIWEKRSRKDLARRKSREKNQGYSTTAVVE